MCISLCLTQCLPVEEEEGRKREREGKEWIEATDRESKETEKKQGKDTQNLSCLRLFLLLLLLLLLFSVQLVLHRVWDVLVFFPFTFMLLCLSMMIFSCPTASCHFMRLDILFTSSHCYFVTSCLICVNSFLCLSFQFEERNITGFKQLIPRVKWEKGK